MNEHAPDETWLRPDEAMNEALEAEQRALGAVRECEREAAKLVESAKERARAILERTDRRIRDLHLRCARATEERVQAMVEEDARESEEDTHREREARELGPAVERLAARLTGRPDER